MSTIFSSDDYHVLINNEVMIFRPTNANARVLILTPPGIKPQFYSILAVLLTKSGIEVMMPRLPLSCNQVKLTKLVRKLSGVYSHDLVLLLGFDIKDLNEPKLVIGFIGGFMTRQLVESRVPGSVFVVPISDCGWIDGSITSPDLVIDGDALSLNAMLSIRELVINKVLHILGANKNKWISGK
ncbi:hypothetical protein [Vulcanisaeta souniana]|uniref:Alpha/beta hydrolase n=1 Tax=Vulcanisaeta souniana JCM 11219 TaxID=1293586 RepID=A0A830E3F6_9CREN|nr:hypothetical protein [Vulcanisaeta souniana]BDR92208.1 hypothetical protein Vsou_13010 [Vulcanisaeta souniana JCM 11219]GGI67101.1 hypothetical protein GCM10007112_00080 [Vulcanisaeta souniana JCM 11219]